MAKSSWLRKALGAGFVAGTAYAVWRAIEANRSERATGWEPQPFPFPPQPRTEVPGSGSTAEPGAVTAVDEPEGPWVEPADGACPATHPVKAKLDSGIYHVPGGASYDRTRADRCYVDEAGATRDGLRRAKR